MQWRERIFSTLFLTALIIAALPYISNMRVVLNLGQFRDGLIYSISYLIAIVVTFSRGISFKIRAWVGLFLFFLVGVAILCAIGPASSGRLWLVVFAVLTTLLLGFRAGIIALIITVVAMFLWALGWDHNYFAWSAEMRVVENQGLTSVFTVIFLSTVVTVSLGVFVSVLEKKLEKEQALAQDLKVSNENLQRENKERKLAEAALRKSENRYKSLTNNLSVGIFRTTVGQDGRFVEANPAFLDIFQIDRRENIFDIKIRDLYQNPEERKKFNKKILQHGSVINEELNLKRCDGTPIICSISAVAVKDDDGQAKFFDGVVDDITERKELESSLRQAQKMEAVGTLAGGIAHDFNNLLMVLQGNTSLMLLKTEPSHPLYKYAERIEREIARGSDLTKKLLGFARKEKIDTQIIDFNEIVEEISDAFGRAKKHIIIHKEFATDSSWVHADRNQIGQILLNLFINAGDAMPKGGELFLRTCSTVRESPPVNNGNHKARPYIHLTVKDTGSGMSKQTIDRIFEPFFTTKEKGKGTGLGLASVYGIVKNHHGFIDVESELGIGTTFHVYLPASETDLAIKQKDVKKDLENGNGTILLVDDEETVLDVGSNMLEQLGYKVYTANNGKTGLEIFQENHEEIDLVVLDLIMPGIDGWEVYEKIEENHIHMKVLLSSGFSVEQRTNEILKHDSVSFLPKPYSIHELSEKIKQALMS